MSSILKALKKLEDDKAARRLEDLHIDLEILRPDNSPRFSSAGLLLASLLLLIGGSGTTYMYMKQDKVSGHTKQESTVMIGQNKQLAPSASDVKTELLPAAVVVVPAHQTANKETSKRHQPTVPIRTVAAPKPVRSALVPPQKSHLPPLPTSVKEAPALRVNGIAFQDEGADSVAMINGSPASSGSEINGVKIEEIYKNKVRFSYNGESFEIQLGQSNR